MVEVTNGIMNPRELGGAEVTLFTIVLIYEHVCGFGGVDGCAPVTHVCVQPRNVFPKTAGVFSVAYARALVKQHQRTQCKLIKLGSKVE